jgi:hypothetical protein
MTQVALPTSDISNVNWGPTPLFAYIGTPTPDDADPISTPVPPGGLFEVQLSLVARPITGTHTLTVRFDEICCLTPALVTFALVQGSQTIAARSVQPTGTFTSYDLVLTEDEVDLITDYGDLSVLVVVGGGSGSGSCAGSGGSVAGSRAAPGSLSGVSGFSSGAGSKSALSGSSGSSTSGPGTISTTCCEVGISSTLYLSISAGVDCPLHDQTATLVYNASLGTWSGIDTSTCALTWHLSCFLGTWVLSTSLGVLPCMIINPSQVVLCGPPFSFLMTASEVSCCTGCTSGLTITIIG